MIITDKIVAEAVSWVGTPYHHRACIKGVGADCATFVQAVLVSMGAIKFQELPYYSTQWFLHSSDERYLEEVLKIADEVEEPRPGDLAMFPFGRAYAHGAIVVAWPRIIHASRMARAVVYGDASVDGELQQRVPRFFRLKAATL